ncbi:MAG: UDP-N-acetylmuramoyl-tripeptide--D-alanyl-D-alanine ligase [Chthonomonadales bacterium]|nr:UDP-N-acetylmuramoyl-tripeptide--D-alanyl-D-alanine ligase [Chthonomonadales bacterium]
MGPIGVAELARIVGARVRGPAGGLALGVCIDSRQGAAGSVFFALRGERADGHAFVRAAFEAGAAAAVVERAVDGAGQPQLEVADPLTALGDLARAWRSRFDLPLVGVTGSVGKTSTRDMVAAALGPRLRVHASESNHNNEIGVPLTLLGLAGDHEAAVVEMAMRGAGQIAHLCEIARPIVGVVTNVGVSHLELLGSRQAIADAKAELLEALPSRGAAVLPADDPFVERLTARCRCRALTFGLSAGADVRVTDLAFGDGGEPRFRLNGLRVTLRAPGVHHARNAAAAVAAALALGLKLEEAVAGLDGFRAPAMRMEVITGRGGVLVLNDTYNAAPDSMAAALATLALRAASPGARAVAVLGDMKELGAYSEEAHRYVGELPEMACVGLLVTVGREAEAIACAARARLPAEAVVSLTDTLAAAGELPRRVRPGDVVLVKGSRAMEMERIVRALAA